MRRLPQAGRCSFHDMPDVLLPAVSITLRPCCPVLAVRTRFLFHEALVHEALVRHSSSQKSPEVDEDKGGPPLKYWGGGSFFKNNKYFCEKNGLNKY